MSNSRDRQPRDPSEGPPKSDSSDGDVNPYVPPSSAAPEKPNGTASASGEKKIDYSGGIWSVLAIGLLVGVLLGFVWEGIVRDFFQAFVAIVLWVGSFALLGALLSGTAKQRCLRAMLLTFISVPAFILYVPVCVAGSAVLDGGSESPLNGSTARTISSVIGALLSITIAAIVLRTVTRRRLRREPPPHRSSESPSPNE